MQVARQRMRVLEPESREMHLRVPIRHVVTILVRIKQQVGRHQHPRAAVSRQHAGGHVQSVEERFRRLEFAIAILVFQNRDLVRPAVMARRRRRHSIELGAQVLIVRGHGDAGRKGILEILHDPQAPPLVKFQIDRLPHHRFACHQLHRVTWRWRHAAHALLGRQRARLAREVLPTRFEALHEVLHFRSEARTLRRRARRLRRREGD
jgi:hypothetical protein